MAKRIFNGKPAFVGQALLILLPLVVLAAVSALSLRQDRILALHDATERAQSIAEDLAPKIWSQLEVTNPPRSRFYQGLSFDTQGQRLSPPPAFETLWFMVDA